MAAESEHSTSRIGILGQSLRSGARRARRIRELAAARVTVRLLHDRVQELARTPVDWGAHQEPIRAELRAIRDEIERGDLLDVGAIDGLAQLSKKEPLAGDDVVAYLGALERMLAAHERRLRAEAGQMPPAYNPPLPPGVPPEPHATPTAPTGSGDVSISEAALLAGMTEKFYGSAAFKALGVALVGAVLLAATGTVLIGNQSINIRDNLDKTAKAAEDQINAQKSQAEAQIATQQKQAADLQTSFDKQTTAFQQHVQSANASIDNQLTLFVASSKQLGETAVTTAIDAIRKDLQSNTSTLRQTIDKAATDQTNEVNREGQAQLATLKQSFVPLQTKVNDQAKALSDFDQQVAHSKETMAQLETLKPMADKAQDIQKTLNGLSDQRNQLTAAVGEAQRQAGNAANSAEGAEKSRQSVVETLGTVNKELTGDMIKIGQFRERNTEIDNGQAAVTAASQKAVADMQKAARDFPDADAKRQVVTGANAALVTALQPQLVAMQTTVLEPARQASQDAAKASQDATKGAKTIHDAAATAAQDLTTASTALGEIQKDVLAAQKALQDSPHATAGGPDWQQHDQAIMVRIAALEAQVADLADPAPASQARLTLAGWKRIQAALTQAGFDTGGVDGKPGGATTKAIRDYQHSLSQPETGQLTPPQLRVLWHPAVSKAGNAAAQLQPMTPAR